MKSKEYSGYVRVRAEELNYSFKVWTESWSLSSCFCPTLVCRKLVTGVLDNTGLQPTSSLFLFVLVLFLSKLDKSLDP